MYFILESKLKRSIETLEHSNINDEIVHYRQKKSDDCNCKECDCKDCDCKDCDCEDCNCNDCDCKNKGILKTSSNSNSLLIDFIKSLNI